MTTDTEACFHQFLNLAGVLMKIYKLEKNHSDVFDGFELPDGYMSLTGKKSYDEGEPLNRSFDFARFRVSSRDYSIPSLKDKWDCPEMGAQNRVAPFNDFPCCGFFIPIFSEKAVVVLNDLLIANGELLPVKTKRGRYFAYQTRTIVDGIVNLKKCEDVSGEFDDVVGVYDDIGTPAFYKSKIPKDLSIFRLREHPSGPFVSQHFVTRALSNGLQGFDFRQVFPPQTVAERRAARAAGKTKVLLDGKQVDPQKQTMKMMFAIKGAPKRKQEKFEEIVQEVQDLLVLDNLKDDFLGAVQMTCAVAGEIYISTPNAKRLEEHLNEFIASNEWATPTVESKKQPFWVAYKSVFS